MKELKKNLKYIKFIDLLSPFIFFIALPFALIFRLINKIGKKEIWLICEDGISARDNGYCLYKYIREKHPKDACYYVIKKNSKDYKKVEHLGNIIEFKSFKHWVYYLSAKYNISNQKSGNPNQPFFYVFHVKLNLLKNRVFLQHGITKDKSDWLLYKNTKFKYFICGAKREYEYIISNFGYPLGSVQYTGLARFDNLHNITIKKNQILIMPTWRNWLGRETNKLQANNDFTKTDFYNYWNNFLNDSDFINFIEKNNLEIIFYPHINMQKYLANFKISSRNIKLVNTETDIQTVLKESAVLITDYSSVFMDFAYMEKPIIYFQFDKEEYREKQLQEGYFSYEKDGFGPICTNNEEIIKYIKLLNNDNFQTEEKYLKRMKELFELKDQHNCERHYNLLKEESK